MSQTLLATLALVVAMSFTLSVYQKQHALQRATIFRELQEMAAAVGVETMEIIRTRAFDQAVVDGSVTGTPDDILLFSDSTDFGVSGTCAAFGGTATCDDIDDFHNQQPIRPFVLGRDTIYFQVIIQVEYVEYNPAGEPVSSSTKTEYKRVKLAIQDYWKNGRHPYIPIPIKLERTFSYKF
ncbi:MAG: hypothetical protein Q9M35_01110 [Rhodothermus sp.]|nr:hypothetical protein [Rhodothermus sp.]